MVQPNMGSDPINPKYYDGTACAEIIEHMPTNVAFAVKYAWRLGEKDSVQQEAKKAIWYLERQMNLPYVPFIGSMFYGFCRERTSAAINAGKLDANRATIVDELVNYTITNEPDRLRMAIALFQQYLD